MLWETEDSKNSYVQPMDMNQGGTLEGWGEQRGGGIEGKNWENGNSIINSKYFKNKDKEKILKVAREKETVTYKGDPIRLSADFSKETLQTRRGWKEVFKVMKGKDLHPRLLYPEKLSFRMEGKIKYFSDKVKLKEFIITKPLLYEMLKGLI